MLKNSRINQIVQIKEFHCKMSLEMKYYSKQKGKIKGIKNLKKKQHIFLIEFLNYNRVWAMTREFELLS